MRNIYLVNNVRDAYTVKDIEELIPLHKSDKILLAVKKYNDSYQIFRKEKISFLDENIVALDITKEEYEELVQNKQKDNVGNGIIKEIYRYDNGDIIEKYSDMYDGLIKLITEYEYKDINITEYDIARDDRLINFNEEEFTFNLAQIKLENENL